MTVHVGIRDLRENLAAWLDRAAAGEEIVVTERGRPEVRLTPAENPLERLAREGRLRRATRSRGPLPPPIEMEGSIMPDLNGPGEGHGPGLDSDPGADENEQR